MVVCFFWILRSNGSIHTHSTMPAVEILLRLPTLRIEQGVRVIDVLIEITTEAARDHGCRWREAHSVSVAHLTVVA